MPWQQIKVRVPEAGAEAVEQLLLQLGAVSVTLQDAEDNAVFQLEPGSTPLWQQTEVTGLFEHNCDLPRIINALHQRVDLAPTVAWQVEALADKDWERVWMDDFHPMRFGERLWVCPSWTTPPQADACNILLDPGLAFGTGTHPTTALCLEWIDAQDMQDKTVIDYGCGSGILAIAAILCGARHVIGIDNDPQALIACASNRSLNSIAAERLPVYLPDAMKFPAVDIVLANILSGPLQALTPVLAALTLPGGRILLSGVLSEQTSDLLKTYDKYFIMSPPVTRGEWVRIEGVRRS